MHQAVCDACGDNCEVPFRPVDGRPVFCSGCFRKDRDEGNQDHNRGKDRFESSPRRQDHQSGNPYGEQLAKIHAKLDTILTLLSRGTASSSKHFDDKVTEADVEDVKTTAVEEDGKKVKKVAKKKQKIS